MSTPFFGDTDIPAMMAELGVPVTAGSVNGFGILDLNDQVEQLDPRPHGRATVIMRAITLVVQSSLFTAIVVDSAIVADGVNYVVIEPLAEGDGALTKLLLRKA